MLDKIGIKNVKVVKEQELPDGNFPTCPYPNPEIKQVFELAIDMTKDEKADLLLATDPDCDRVGIAVLADGEYKLMSGNEVGVLLTEYLLSRKKEQGTLAKDPIIVKSFVTTNLVEAVAAKYGAKVKNLLTGFKYIGEFITSLEKKGEEDRFVAGMEESYGYLSGIHARDKDAVVASTLICEMAAYYKSQGKSLYEVMQESKNSVASERADLQELISDISHQVKTPIANLKMINATLLEQEVPQDKQREFLLASGTQLDKLDFLMQAMIKTSRLETGVISLEKKQQPIYDTLAMALGGIFLNAERKHIQVEVNCPETLVVSHDRKWTAEALFNILDNAVKYTPEYGSIRVCVESWEMHLKVSVTDTGKGIPENQQGAIFRRFYREENVHDIEGIGIGLYLAREIISLQNGYIQVTSQVGTGSTFSVFLPHE